MRIECQVEENLFFFFSVSKQKLDSTPNKNAKIRYLKYEVKPGNQLFFDIVLKVCDKLCHLADIIYEKSVGVYEHLPLHIQTHI